MARTAQDDVVDPQSVRAADEFVAPRTKELAVAIEAEDRLFSAVKQIHPPPAVEINGGTSSEFHRGRQLQKVDDGREFELLVGGCC